MKKFLTCMVLAFTAALGSMLVIHWREVRDVEQNMKSIRIAMERQETASGMVSELEKYRRMSTHFRVMPENEVVGAKDHLRSELHGGLASLDQLNPDANDKPLIEQAATQFNELQTVAEKLEPTLFSRDVYVKEPARNAHDILVGTLNRIRENAKDQADRNHTSTVQLAFRSMRPLATAAASVLALMALILIRGYFAAVRPVRILRARARALREGQSNVACTPVLSQPCQEIETTLREFAATVDSQRRERQQFITSVALDLRSPLISLKTNADLLANNSHSLTDHQKEQAARNVQRSMFKLTRTLDDLTDILDTDYAKIRLEEKIVDLGDLLTNVADKMGGPGCLHDISVSVPPMPVWASVDPDRLERVLVNLISKLCSLSPQGGHVHLVMSQSTHGKFRGVEILVQDSEQNSRPTQSTGPEQDLLRHWVAENGFGLRLASRVIQAHGGTVTAAGLTGTRVMFSLRLPQERVASGFAASTPALVQGISASLRSARAQTIFAQGAMSFGSL